MAILRASWVCILESTWVGNDGDQILSQTDKISKNGQASRKAKQIRQDYVHQDSMEYKSQHLFDEWSEKRV